MSGFALTPGSPKITLLSSPRAAARAAVCNHGVAGAIAWECDCCEGQPRDVLGHREVRVIDRGHGDERGDNSKADMIDVLASGAHVDQRRRNIEALRDDVETCRDDENSCVTNVILRYAPKLCLRRPPACGT